MSDIRNYRDLKVWQKSMILVEEIFRITDNFPQSQRYVLVNQIQRSSVSVPANIAEGRSRHSEKDFTYHLNVARGSLAELETLLSLSLRLGFISDETHDNLLNQSTEITKMLHGLKAKLRDEVETKKAKTYNLQPVI